ncbi:MAG: preprotein translocase subunit SecG [Candidatus Levybacteria bacterium RIFCSPHIGHO2_01_FULL_37_17]|nr:MAG: preprotein translocase subunit SecG [Candidatus Levybacteria bacterium RIFCSPHIGHO2_01_FULL_37_17]OGH36744.1 MAG: preprotein translocase subunit SecG [Candidatus Levybacteria bacterium RIFCSPLOWO2_01_FULL_38_23]
MPILTILEVVVASLLIILILLQMQGSGLSSAFGGVGEFYRSKRSIEKFLIGATVVTTIAFATISLLLLVP